MNFLPAHNYSNTLVFVKAVYISQHGLKISSFLWVSIGSTSLVFFFFSAFKLKKKIHYYHDLIVKDKNDEMS